MDVVEPALELNVAIHAARICVAFTQVAWKPAGTRVGTVMRARGPRPISRASKTWISERSAGAKASVQVASESPGSAE